MLLSGVSQLKFQCWNLLTSGFFTLPDLLLEIYFRVICLTISQAKLPLSAYVQIQESQNTTEAKGLSVVPTNYILREIYIEKTPVQINVHCCQIIHMQCVLIKLIILSCNYCNLKLMAFCIWVQCITSVGICNETVLQ